MHLGSSAFRRAAYRQEGCVVAAAQEFSSVLLTGNFLDMALAQQPIHLCWHSTMDKQPGILLLGT